MSLLGFAGSAIQLVPDGTILFHIALVVCMVALLNMTLLKPINRILAERERRTKGRLEDAKRVLEDVDEKMVDYSNKLRAARSRGYALLDAERSAALEDRRQKVATVSADVALWCEEQRSHLTSDGANVKADLLIEARRRASEISTRLLGRPVG